MLPVFQRNPIFFILWMLALIGASILHFYYSPFQLQILLNSFNQPQYDTFFIYATKLAEGLMVALVLIYALFQSRAHSFSLVAGWGMATLCTQLLKHTAFDGYPRPGKVFADYPGWNWVEGIVVHNSASFPSGHTTDIFALMTLFALWTKNKYWGLLAFIIAFMVGYSRIYLSQHFVRDVMAGSTIGVCFASLSVYLFFHSNWAQNNQGKLQRKWKS